MELSLILMVWNTSHLLRRTLVTLHNQTIQEPWELIIIDDNSEDDVWGALMDQGRGLPIRYFRLEHDYGMRGNTVSLNTGIEKATGRTVMWSTPEVMLPPGALEAAHAAQTGEKLWVTIPSHGLSAEPQVLIDTVDWQSDIHNIKKLVEGLDEGDWRSTWFHLNFYHHGRPSQGRRKSFGNNQTVAVDRELWLGSVKAFPLFMDYGSDDPFMVDERRRHGYRDVTLWDQEAYHQWHPTSQYWMAQGKAPNWNKHGHTTSNLMNDPHVPKGGTCAIWDAGNREQLSEDERQDALRQHSAVVATGFRRREWR